MVGARIGIHLRQFLLLLRRRLRPADSFGSVRSTYPKAERLGNTGIGLGRD